MHIHKTFTRHSHSSEREHIGAAILRLEVGYLLPPLVLQ
eukprot:COSAG04_NODE_2290_length_4380_cov_2.919411_1_plen_38_part_10